MRTLVFDIGTTNIFALVYIKDKVEDVTSVSIETSNHHTQDPKFILSTVQNLIKKYHDQYKIKEVVFSTAMHTLIYLDENFEATSKMMLWSDTHAEFIFDSLPKETQDAIYKRTGTPLHSMSPLSKILKDKPRSPYISDLKAYLMKHLCGVFVSDYSSASASGLWHLKNKDWDEAILKLAAISKDALPKTVEIDTVFAYQDIERISVVIGSTDGVLANRGIANLEEIVVSAGTSMGIRKLTKDIIVEGGFCYYAGFDTYLVGEASNNGGNVLSWIRESLKPQLRYEKITDYVLESNFDVMCIPYIFGERGPFWKDGITAQINAGYTQKETVQALIYGIFSHAKLMIQSIDDQHEFVYLTGGLFNNKELRCLFSNILEKDFIVYEDDLAVSYGLLSLVNPDIDKASILYHKHEKDTVLQDYITKYIEYLIENTGD